MLENTEVAIKNRQSRETGNIGYTKHRTNKCQRIPKGQSKIDNPEKLARQGTQDTGQIHVREYRRGNKKQTIQRNRQHRVHQTKTGNTKYTAQYVLDTTMRKPTQTTGDKDKPNIVFMWKS